MPATDTRSLFRPVSTELVALLRALSEEDWRRPTVAGTWVVRDIVAHLVDLTFRRLSFHRDAMVPPPPPTPIDSERAFVDFINWLNAQWVDATGRFSPRVLTDLFATGSGDLADWFESLPEDAPGLFGVSWAGEQASEGWFDVGREFTELWHHQQQIRMAVGAPPLADPRYLHAVIEIALRGLPHAFRDSKAQTEQAIVFDVSGPAGGSWTLQRDTDRWTLHAGEPSGFDTRVTMPDDIMWQLLFNALDGRRAAESILIEGDRTLATPLFKARAIVV